jgi:hypothetical protein
MIRDDITGSDGVISRSIVSASPAAAAWISACMVFKGSGSAMLLQPQRHAAGKHAVLKSLLLQQQQCVLGKMPYKHVKHHFKVGYKGGKIYWLAIHSNQANLIVEGLRHRRHQQTRQAPIFQDVPSNIAIYRG